MNPYITVVLFVISSADVFAQDQTWKPAYSSESRYLTLEKMLHQPSSPGEWVAYLANKYGLEEKAHDRAVAGLTKPASAEICRWAYGIIKSGTFDTPQYVFALAILARVDMFPGAESVEPGGNGLKGVPTGGPLIFVAENPEYRYSGLATNLSLYAMTGEMTWSPERFQAKMPEETKKLVENALGEKRLSDFELTTLHSELQIARDAKNSTAESIIRHAIINQTGDMKIALDGLKSSDRLAVAEMVMGLSWLNRPEAIPSLLETARDWQDSSDGYVVRNSLIDSLSQFTDDNITKFFAKIILTPNPYHVPPDLKIMISYLSKHLDNELARKSLREYYAAHSGIMSQLQPIVEEINQKYPMRPEDKK